MREHFDFAAHEIGVDRPLRPRPNGTGYADHEFVADLFRRGERVGPVGIAHDLHQPLAVAQIDEDHAAVVPPSMHPAEQVDRLAQVFAAHKAAVLRSH